jgi:HlyD family secretion protein
MKRIAILVIVLALALGGFGLWYGHASGSPAENYRTAAVQRGDLAATISATGTLEPEEVVDVGAQVAGMIKNFGPDPRDKNKVVDYGTPVEPGTVLAEIDESIYEAQVEQARANLQRAEADLLQMQAKVTQSERDWERAKSLHQTRGVISDVDYDTAQATYLSAKSALAVGQAAVAQNKAALKQAEVNLGYCTIKSPVKGVIVDRRVNVGQTVVSSLNAPSLFLIAKDLRRMQIWASVNEADIGQIHVGQPVRFTVDAYPNEQFKGEVSQVRLNAAMTQNVVTYTVVVTTDNPSGKLLPYLTANLEFEVSRRANALLVANAALRWQPQAQQVAPDAEKLAKAAARDRPSGKTADTAEAAGRGTVWVRDGNYVRPIRVVTGLTDGAMTELVGGDLPEGAQVVVGTARPEQTGANSATNPFTPQLFGNKKGA